MNIVKNGEFDSVISNNKLVMMTFSTNWCGPCKMLSTTLENIEFDGVYISKIDAEENITISTHFGIRSVPTTLFFRDGKIVDELTFVGMLSKDNIIKKLNDFKNG